MIGTSGDMRVYLACGMTDMRRGIEGLLIHGLLWTLTAESRQEIHYAKLLGPRLMAQDFDRQVAEVLFRIAIMNGYTVLGIPVAKTVG